MIEWWQGKIQAGCSTSVGVKGCANISGKKCQSELFKEAKSQGQEKGIKGLDLTCKTHLLEKNSESNGQQLILDAVFTETGLTIKLIDLYVNTS